MSLKDHDALKQLLNARAATPPPMAYPWITGNTIVTTNQTGQTAPSKQISFHVDPVDNGYIITGFKNGRAVRRIASSENLMDEIQGVFATLKLEE